MGSSPSSSPSAAEFWVFPSPSVSPDFSTSEAFSPDFSTSEVFSSSAFRFSVGWVLSPVLSPVMMMSSVPSPSSLMPFPVVSLVPSVLMVTLSSPTHLGRLFCYTISVSYTHLTLPTTERV